MTALSAEEARWLALEAQRLAAPRPPDPGADDLRQLVDDLGTVQLDAVNVVERTQVVVPHSRLGHYDPALLRQLSGPGGDLFEFWGHAASVQPVARQPLYRWRMEQHRTGELHGPTQGPRYVAWRQANAAYVDRVLAEVAARGPLTAASLEDPRRRQGEWWGRRSVGRQALEWLFAAGEVAGWRNDRFERVYDLPERVLPAEVLARPTPTAAEAKRELLRLAAGSLGVATVADLADYHRVGTPTAARPLVTDLVASGDLVEVAVEGWAEPGWCPPGAMPRPPARQGATLLSPFDSLIWERRRTERLFGFSYRIEIYVPEPKRRYGYYVLPVLLGDRLVARLDLKADRRGSVLRVPGAFLEVGEEAGEVAAAAAPALRDLGTWLGLAGVAVGRRGDLAAALRRALV